MIAILRRAFDALGSGRRLIAGGLLVAALQSAILLPIGLLVRDVFDHAIPESDERAIVLASLGSLALYTASAVLGLISRRAVIAVTKPAVARLRRDMLARMHALPHSWRDRQDTARLHATLVQDSERVDQMLSHLANPVLTSGAIALALAVAALILNPLLTAVSAAVVPLMLGVTQVFGRRVRHTSYEHNEALRRFSADSQRGLRALGLAKAHGAERVEVERAGPVIDAVADAGRRVVAAQTLHQAVQGAIAAAAGTVVLIVGGIAVTAGSMTLGDLFAFYAIIGLLIRQASGLANGIDHVLAGIASMEQVDALLATREPEPYRGSAAPPARLAIALEHVRFGYGERPVLDGVDLTLTVGEWVAIVGPNGAGKSTLVNLVLGLYRPQAGRLLAGGRPYDELDVHALRASMGVVLQDPLLFAGSVRENIAYGAPGASDAAIRVAAERATAHPAISALQDGYDTQIGDEGERLSGGLRQRIALARALLGEPALLVLDEPTTFLDDAGIDALMDNVAQLPSTPTVLLVTHDPSVAARADHVVTLRDGRVSSQPRHVGSHEL